MDDSLIAQIQALTNRVAALETKEAFDILMHQHSGTTASATNYGDLIGGPDVIPYGGDIISNAAGAFFPSGWSAAHTGTGLYTITHKLATTAYAAIAIPLTATLHASIAAQSANSVEFQFQNGAGTNVDTDFNFMLVS